MQVERSVTPHRLKVSIRHKIRCPTLEYILDHRSKDSPCVGSVRLPSAHVPTLELMESWFSRRNLVSRSFTVEGRYLEEGLRRALSLIVSVNVSCRAWCQTIATHIYKASYVELQHKVWNADGYSGCYDKMHTI